MVNTGAALLGSIVLGTATGVLAQPAANCKLAQVADWPVVSTRGVPVVEGSIDGHKVGVMLDTGGVTMMFRAAAERLGLTRQVVKGYRVFGVGGETYVEATTIDEFRIGQLTRKSWQVMVAGEHDPGGSVDVVLGEDVFDKLDVEFDLPHNHVRLFQAKDCGAVALAYWAPQTASRIDLEPDQRIILKVKINGQPLQAQLDSGSTVSVLDKSAAERVGLTPDSPGVVPSVQGGGLGAKPVDAWIGPVRSLTIGEETISDTAISFADLWKDETSSPVANHLPQKLDSGPAMLLGADFLRSHRVLVSNSQRKMYFTYEGGPVFQPKAGTAAARGASDGQAAGRAPPAAVAKPEGK